METLLLNSNTPLKSSKLARCAVSIQMYSHSSCHDELRLCRRTQQQLVSVALQMQAVGHGVVVRGSEARLASMGVSAVTAAAAAKARSGTDPYRDQHPCPICFKYKRPQTHHLFLHSSKRKDTRVYWGKQGGQGAQSKWGRGGHGHGVVSSESMAHLVIFKPGWMEKSMECIPVPDGTWGPITKGMVPSRAMA